MDNYNKIDFRTDPNLTKEERMEIAADNWLEAAYNIRKEKEAQRKYWEKNRKDEEEIEKKRAEIMTKEEYYDIMESLLTGDNELGIKLHH